MAPPERPRIAWLCYRGNPIPAARASTPATSLAQLAELGCDVTVFAGQPWPVLDPGVAFVPVPSLDLYRRRFPFWWPWPWQLRTRWDWLEWGKSMTGQFPEAHTFSYRVAHELLGKRRGDFDLVHDNQCLGTGLRPVMAAFPFLATIHHPITVDFELERSHATSAWRRFSLKRWYSFLPAQVEIAHDVPRVVTVSESSKRDIAEQMGVPKERMAIVAVGVDHTRFCPRPEVKRIRGRLLTTASGDVPLKGSIPLLGAGQGADRTRRRAPDSHRQVARRQPDTSRPRPLEPARRRDL